MKGYHFTGDTLRNGEPIPPVDEWLVHDGPVEPCRSGLHASEHPLDALRYAPGDLLHRVELGGDLQPHGDPIDKWVGRRRKIIATIDAEPLLREFARWCALQVIDLWDAPAVVHEYLEGGDESLREAAWAAAWAAAREAAWAAAREAAWAAAWAATREAAWAAAWAATREAACDAAWAAARAAQRTQFAAIVEAAFDAAEAAERSEG
jgi:hypothetical protein